MRSKLTYANVVSTLCLFIVLGGGAYAAGVVHLPKNSVGNKQLKKNAVTGVKVKDGSLKGADIDLATLGNVPSAASAKDAQSVNGQSAAQIAAAAKLQCPAGTLLVAGACLEKAQRTATGLQLAMVRCGQNNRRVATLGELIAYGLTQESISGEWAEPIDSAFKGAIVSASLSGSTSLGFAESATSHPYRCATSPSN